MIGLREWPSVTAAWSFAHGPADLVSGRPIIIGTDGTLKPGGTGYVASVTSTANLGRVTLQPNVLADKPGAGDFTVWIRFILRSTTFGYSIIGRWNTGGTMSSCDWVLGSYGGIIGNTHSFTVACGSTAINAEMASSWSVGTEYLLVGRRRGTTVLVDRLTYVNGLPVGAWESTSTTSASVTTINSNSARALKLGEIDLGAAYNSSFDAIAAGLHGVALTDHEVRQLPFALWRGQLAPEPEWMPMEASATSDVTVALSGQAVTASAGALVVGASVGLSGQAATASAGTVALGASVALAGEAVTAGAGTITYQVAGDVTVALTGQAVAVEAGALVYEPYVERPASGVPGRWYTSIKGRAHFGSREEIEALLRQVAQDHAEEDERLEALGEKPLKRKVRVVQPGRAQVKETKGEQTVVTLPAAVAELSGVDSAQALAIYRVAYGLHKRREELREKRQKAAEKLEAQERAEIVAALNKAIGGMTSRPATMSDLAALERRIMRAIK